MAMPTPSITTTLATITSSHNLFAATSAQTMKIKEMKPAILR